ncbi:hypothetical protein [Dictyobacter aurantiacus]|uniref:Uncharacterized protein n=1 Tax=Dictyobacter aurantiacus TaxID=1936993 RepID=A0A401ZIM6_9CHLR|nr:hypothetical protein [Dictyobacter aurantiacus]GCE06697.1 hypothetical protein KDAU_40260 [Dictyobacter aurantiacus]
MATRGRSSLLTSRWLLRIFFALVVSGLLVLAFFATNVLSH